jgi:hypothetical protein
MKNPAAKPTIRPVDTFIDGTPLAEGEKANKQLQQQ